HCVAKGDIPDSEAGHICYCHTPMRYVWDMYDSYFGKGKLKWTANWIIPPVASYLRMWDTATSHRVDWFVANSDHVRKRINRYYGREADVIYPPVNTAGTFLSEKDDGYFLIVSAFAPYKRVDLAIQAFNELGERLVVVGTGQDEKRLKKIARTNIEFVGWMDSDKLQGYYAGCCALIFPGEEDFGIVPVEAQCFGKPVLAYGVGGVLETVNGIHLDEDSGNNAGAHTGIFFRTQEIEQIKDTVKKYRSLEFDGEMIRKHALRFDIKHFKKKYKDMVMRSVR
ncbi:hypothetical protein BVY01_03500, partial [bacterium I07]